MSISVLIPLVWSWAALTAEVGAGAADVALPLVPQPQVVDLKGGFFPLRAALVAVRVPGGQGFAACRAIIEEALESAGARVQLQCAEPDRGIRFILGGECELPPLPFRGHSEGAYALAVEPTGVSAVAASPAGLLYAAQTLRQLARLAGPQGRLQGMTIVDYPEFERRGIYIEGGQERFGCLVERDYLCQQIRRLAEFKMNTLVVECYNLFPYPSYPACADAATLSAEDCDAIVTEAKRYHVTIVPSLQTLAQSYEVVWNCDAGEPYRELTAPGQMCPSTPEVYPLVKGLYRDLLERFDTSPLIGIGCSEIDMQWRGRYCPKCQARIAAGQTVRDLLLGHAERCIRAVEELATELKRPVRPFMWADEFYMYGAGKDWAGISRIPKTTVMGYWKYWADYQGIGGLMERGYDVLGISAMYNHTFYLADLSPEMPRKRWPAMEQTGIRNITELIQQAAKDRQVQPGKFLGTATASFSKHRLRAFDSIWYGFALNGQCTWSRPERPIANFQRQFTRAFVRHAYDCRSDAAADVLAAAWERLDQCKSQLELANQTLHDVVGVYDTQEPGYQGNTLVGAWQRCRDLLEESGEPQEGLAKIRDAAIAVQTDVREVHRSLEAQRSFVGRGDELDDLLQAGKKIAAHAEREVLLIDSQVLLSRAPGLAPAIVRERAAAELRRWQEHRATIESLARRDARLYQRGDPCGHTALLKDVGEVEKHLFRLLNTGVAD